MGRRELVTVGVVARTETQFEASGKELAGEGWSASEAVDYHSGSGCLVGFVGVSGFVGKLLA